MDRRSFLATATSAWVAPHWLAQAFGMADGTHQDRGGDDDRIAQLRRARQRANSRGKPLLLLVVPAQESERWPRGTFLGAFLNHATTDALCDLAMCEIACGTPDEAKVALGKIAIPDDAPILLVEPGEAKDPEPPRTTAVAAGLHQDVAEVARAENMSLDEWLAANEKRATERNAQVARSLHAAVAPDKGALAARADAARATLEPGERAALDELFAGTAVPAPALLVRAAAVVCMAAEAPRRGGDRERLRTAVAAAASKTFLEQRVAGSKWARSTGCGSTIEGEKEREFMVACGMGHIPPLGERFLWFFTKQ